ncbi:hypothetical protein D9C73_012862 [Collichthys lucidus]|uniref:Uncharacterized protein n=1 Tax=Collichthys lucidus TaxID=240159 RepID=A0A4V6ASP0_COLLU|nr:hypothetical protein D9C73_012862 [Collichthys lucidus]
MLLMSLFLLCSVPAASACLQCDRSIRLLHEDYILSAPTVDNQIEMKKIRDYAYVTYKDTSRQRKGVIDPTTLYRARTEYQSEFDRFLKTPHTEYPVQAEEGGQVVLNCFLPWHRLQIERPELADPSSLCLPCLTGDGYSPFEPTEGLLLSVIATVTALSLVASVGLTVVLR